MGERMSARRVADMLAGMYVGIAVAMMGEALEPTTEHATGLVVCAVVLVLCAIYRVNERLP